MKVKSVTVKTDTPYGCFQSWREFEELGSRLSAFEADYIAAKKAGNGASQRWATVAALFEFEKWVREQFHVLHPLPEMMRLLRALTDLDRGTVHPVLRPSKRTRVMPSAQLEYMVGAAARVTLMLRTGMKLDAACRAVSAEMTRLGLTIAQSKSTEVPAWRSLKNFRAQLLSGARGEFWQKFHDEVLFHPNPNPDPVANATDMLQRRKLDHYLLN